MGALHPPRPLPTHTHKGGVWLSRVSGCPSTSTPYLLLGLPQGGRLVIEVGRVSLASGETYLPCMHRGGGSVRKVSHILPDSWEVGGEGGIGE